jgi:hypothetical protein
MEGLAAGGTEAVPVVERVQTPLFLMDSDLMDLPFALEADKDSEEDSGCGSENEGIGGRNKNTGSGGEDSDDGDTMVE